MIQMQSCIDIDTGASIVVMTPMMTSVLQISRIDLIPIKLSLSDSQSANDEAEMWNLVKDSHDAKLIQQYSNKYPDGAYKDLAQQKLDAIKSGAAALLYFLHSDQNVKEKKIYVDDVEAARIERGCFFGLKLSAGEHQISDGNDTLTLVAGPGQDYFVKVGKTGLSFWEDESALMVLKSLNPVSPKKIKSTSTAVTELPLVSSK